MKTFIYKSKSLLAIAGLCFLCASLYFGARYASRPAKYYRVENETSPRPDRFEELKFHVDPGVEQRLPASTDH